MKSLFDNKMIVAKDCYFNLDTHQTKVNNNVLVVGSAGAGKTRSIVMPNLLQATGSYIVSDPKGNLYRQFKPYLESKGYVVKKLDFTHPDQSEQYNFFHYIHEIQDLNKVAALLMPSDSSFKNDPFWDQASELLLRGIMGFIWESLPEEDHNLQSILKLLVAGNVNEDCSSASTTLDRIMDSFEESHPQSSSVRAYKMSRAAAGRTLKSVLITIFAKLGRYDTPALNKMMSRDSMDIASIGEKKTAVFVVVSDTDRSMDTMANMFFSQAMQELCYVADNNYEDNRLPVPVRFILDDFATNCKIDEFPRMISSVRSREISAMLMIQAESQLEEYYGKDSKTIIGNCDTYVYLGGNDIETAKAISERTDLPLDDILYMPIGHNWVFRRGQRPIFSENFDLESFKREKMGNGALEKKKIVWSPGSSKTPTVQNRKRIIVPNDASRNKTGKEDKVS